RRPDDPLPAAYHRRRVGPPLPRPVLPLRRHPAGRRDRHGGPDRRRSRPPPAAQPDPTRLPARQHPRAASRPPPRPAPHPPPPPPGSAAPTAARTRHQHAIALPRQLAAESLNIDGTNPVTARQLAVAAWAVFPTGQAASTITTLLAEQQ